MGETTEISWCDSTFSPWWGRQRVSPGCEHCYAEAWAKRTGHGVWGPTAPRRFFGAKHWAEPLKWNEKARAAGKRSRVFCASMADVFEDRADLVAERERLFGLIASTPHLDWLLLTKRPENIARLMPSATAFEMSSPWPNIWLGTTVEDQERAEERIPHLLAVPAAVRFLSCEPLLGPLDLSRWLDEDDLGFVNSEIDWIIIGGESGPKARPFDLAWARSLIAQCRDGGRSVEPVPFVKQLGASAFEDGAGRGCQFEMTLRDRKGADPSEWPADLRVREFPEVRR